MVPTHNSTLGLDIARSAAIKHNLTTAIFSLEMSRNEITMRLLSAEARVPLHQMRSGKLTDDDWTQLARRMGEVAEAPLFIDDTPNMSMMEIRAKCRRLKQRNDLKLVVIDYLQLMSSGKRVESRQQEVSEFSRALKLLAKELEVPVIAITQLNRGPEQRTDKQPQLSRPARVGLPDRATRVLRADTGAEVTMGELFASGARDVPVWSLDDSLRYVARGTMTHVFPTGHARGLPDHAGVRQDGPGDGQPPASSPTTAGGPSASSRPAPASPSRGTSRPPETRTRGPTSEVVLLAHLIGDGSFVTRQPIRYASVDEANLAAVTTAAQHFGITAVRDDYPAARVTTLRLPRALPARTGQAQPDRRLARRLGLFGLRSHEKFVPDEVFSPARRADRPVPAPPVGDRRLGHREQARPRRPGLLRLDQPPAGRRRVRDCCCGSASPARVQDVAQGRLPRPAGRSTSRRARTSCGSSRRSASTVHAARRPPRCSAIVRDDAANPNVDTVPAEVWDRVRDVLAEQGMTPPRVRGRDGHASSAAARVEARPEPGAARPGRRRARTTPTSRCWPPTTSSGTPSPSIERDGVEEVFDATVLGTHNFVANGIAVHNCIEQDADMVILLHREDVYEKESPRAGEADFIVAKHRNGPTATITVAFQGHYSRFVDMAQS